MSAPKVPAAVVYLERPDGRVLAVPRKGPDGWPDYSDWHFPGGKWERADGWTAAVVPGSARAHVPLDPSPDPSDVSQRIYRGVTWSVDLTDQSADLVATAIREVTEETGVRLEREHLRPIHDYVTRSGRPVRLFLAQCPAYAPDRFALYPTGIPAWQRPEMTVLPWCSLAYECQIILEAVVMDRHWREDWIP